jgi:hypothetical protein
VEVARIGLDLPVSEETDTGRSHPAEWRREAEEEPAR